MTQGIASADARHIPLGIEYSTGNIEPLLHEIRHALQRLIECGETSIIDLRRIPLAPNEEDRIEQLLGAGEVRAELDALGSSKIRETGFSGVWIVEHRNTEDELVGKFIEVTRVPSILESQDADIETAIARLREQLSGDAAHAQPPASLGIPGD